MTTPRTTAYVRSLAYDAARAKQYRLAASLYAEAADLYPAEQIGALAQQDISYLRTQAAMYTREANYQEANP